MFILVSLKTLSTNMVCVSTGHLDLHILVEEQDFLGLEEGICLFSTVAHPVTFLPINKRLFLERVISLFRHCLCFRLIFLLFIPETLTKQREYID